MTSPRTSTMNRRSLRAATLALLTGAGIALTPLTATATPAAFTAAPTSSVSWNHPGGSWSAHVAVRAALAQQGKPYAWGGTGPHGYDCSGLTFSSYQAAGVHLPRTSGAQSTAGVQIPWYAMQPGDLIFFYSPVGHVGMAIGNGLMVHSSTYGEPVKVVRVDSMPGYHSTRRVA